MATLPDQLALTSIPDGGAINAAPLRNDFAAVQTAVNALIAALGGGSAGSILEALDANDVDWNGGVYSDYSSSLAWTASGTAPALGNAAKVARYARLGKLVHSYGQISFGSTSTFGTGTYNFSLPVAANANGHNIGTVAFSHNATNAFGVGEAAFLTASTFGIFYGATYLGTATQAAATAPWTWAANDIIQWNILYEAA